MKPQKQTVFLPVNVKDELPEETGFYKTEEEGTSFFQRGDSTWWNNDTHFIKRFPEHWLKPQEGYFFTHEELNEYTQNVIKQALENAAENTETLLWQNNEDLEIVSNRVAYIVEDLKIKQAITNTFEETFNKHKV
jgi:hypothetical protein